MCARCLPGSESGPGSTSCSTVSMHPNRRNLPESEVPSPAATASALANGGGGLNGVSSNIGAGSGATVQAIWSFALLFIVGGIVRRLSTPFASKCGQNKDTYAPDMQRIDHCPPAAEVELISSQATKADECIGYPAPAVG